jgi:hypothetical protein
VHGDKRHGPHNPPCPPPTQPRDTPPPTPTPSPCAVEHALVLRLCGDDMALLVLVEARHPLEGQVVALCGSRGEYDFFGVCVDQRSNLGGGV